MNSCKYFYENFFIFLLFSQVYDKLGNIRNEFKQSVLPPTYTEFSVRKRGGIMVESYLIYTIYLLFFGLVGVTTINIALIVALAILLSKQ